MYQQTSAKYVSMYPQKIVQICAKTHVQTEKDGLEAAQLESFESHAQARLEEIYAELKARDADARESIARRILLVCVYVFMYATYVCMYVRVCVYSCMCCTKVSLAVFCWYACMYICIYVYIYIYTYGCIYVHVHPRCARYVHVNTYVSIYLYIHLYTHT